MAPMPVTVAKTDQAMSRSAPRSRCVGLLTDDVAEEGVHLSLMVGQPVRVGDAEAKLTLPTGRRKTVLFSPSAEPST